GAVLAGDQLVGSFCAGAGGVGAVQDRLLQRDLRGGRQQGHSGVVGVGDWVGLVDRVAGDGGGVQQVFGDRGVVGVDELVAGFEVDGVVTGDEGHLLLGDA